MTDQPTYPDPEVIDGSIPSDSRSVRAALRSVRPPNMGPPTEPRPDPWDAHRARGDDPVVGAWTTTEGDIDD